MASVRSIFEKLGLLSSFDKVVNGSGFSEIRSYNVLGTENFLEISRIFRLTKRHKFSLETFKLLPDRHSSAACQKHIFPRHGVGNICGNCGTLEKRTTTVFWRFKVTYSFK